MDRFERLHDKEDFDDNDDNDPDYDPALDSADNDVLDIVPTSDSVSFEICISSQLTRGSLKLTIL